MDFIRFETLIDKDKYLKLIDKKIIVIGVGGVGGYVVEALVRCGINNIMIIDYDKVDVTNKNRQIIATDDVIGKYKVEVFKDRIHNINKNCNVSEVKLFLDESNTKIVTDYNPDFIIDACDSIKTKEKLIDIAINNNINFITSMGTGKRLDASKLTITTLNKTSGDPIARILRKYCKDNHIKSNFKVLYSSELPIKKECDFITSVSYVPSCGGLLIASYVINKLLEDM